MSAAVATAPAPAGRAMHGFNTGTQVNTAAARLRPGNGQQTPADICADARLIGLDRLHRVARTFRRIDTGLNERHGERLADLVERLNGEQDPRERSRLFGEVERLRDALDVNLSRAGGAR